MSELSRLISAEIARHGPLRFDRFMDLALYHPAHGYYRREREKPRTGRQGDFFTSVNVGPLFGRLLARQFLQMWENLEKPHPFWIIEQGAEDAQLACDILSWSRAETPAFFAAAKYAVIEESASARARQKEKLQAQNLTEKITWFPAPETLAHEQPTGVFFSNELADALHVRLVRHRQGHWRELHVTATGENNFTWIETPIDDRELADDIETLPLPAREGYTTEIHRRARDWMEATGTLLQKGYLVTIDYGFPASIYYAPSRAHGTLTAYREHRRTEEILRDPGSRDITAHVDFTGLARAGEKAGLNTLGFLDQQHFLMGIAHDELSGTEGPHTALAENLRAWHTLTHPDYFGARFQVLIQAKAAPPRLACLRYARPSPCSGGL